MKLNQLQRVVKQAINEEKATELLREEATRVLGPIMDTDVRLEELAEAINDRVAVLERTGRESRMGFKPSVLAKFVNHKDAEVRKMCARLLPERFLKRFATDRNHAVRATAAKRLPLKVVKAMAKRFPKDVEVRRIYTERRHLQEAHEDELLNMYEDRLGDAAKQQDVPSLSEEWYRTQADLFMQDYGQDKYAHGGTTGQSLDYNWEEDVVRNFCRHSKATNGVEIDESKLLKALSELIKEREECVLKKEATSNLKELASRLYEEHDRDLLNESPIMPCLSEDVDPVSDLVSSRVSPATYMECAEDMFGIRFARMAPGLKKYRMGEGIKDQLLPMKGRLPHGSFRPVDERALDLYVEHWNEKQALTGEPVRIAWNPDPGELGVFGFEVILR